MRDFKRIVKGVVLEQQVADVDLNPSTDSGAMINFENRIRVFLNGIVKEALTITRASTSSLQTYISQSKIANGEMVFNTTENTFQQVLNGQLVSLGSGGGGVVDPELENRVSQLETDVASIDNRIDSIEIQLEDVEDNLAIVRSEAYDLIELTGLPENSKDLGTFTGEYLQDGMNIKQALQAIETAVELGLGESAGGLSSLNTQIEQLEDALAAEQAARISGDSSTLSSANAYTDNAIAAIPPAAEADLSVIEGQISSLDSSVVSLQGQIDTINDTTIPTAINTAVTSANGYTDSQILSASSGSMSQSDLYSLLGVLYFENFEGVVKGTLTNGASLSDYDTTPLNVLDGQKSLYLSHDNSIQKFTSNNIQLPLFARILDSNLAGNPQGGNPQIAVKFTSLTTIAGDGTTPKALLKVYDVSNGVYLINAFTNSENIALLSYNAFSGRFIASTTTEQIRVEVISNTTGGGVTIVDNIVVSVKATNISASY